MSEQNTIPPFPADDWDKVPESVQAFVMTLLQRIEDQDRRIAQLEEQLKLNSQNSNKPPSSDQKRKKKKRSSGKKRGGQPGHKGHSRSFLPPAQVTQFVICKPDKCDHCSAPLGKEIRIGRHQIIELPDIRPIVTEFQLYSCVCSGCGKSSKGRLPEGIPSGSYGPRLIAFSGLLTGHFQLSKRLTHEFLSDCFHIPISLGTISNHEKLLSNALKAPYDELVDVIPQQDELYVDETRFDQKGDKGWLWAFVSDDWILYQHRENRRRTILEQLIGPDMTGIIVSDRYRAYEYFDGNNRQICWAHLVRDFERFRVRGGESERVGDLLLGQSDKMFELWHRVRDGTLERATFEKRMEKIQREVEHFLGFGLKCGHAQTAGTCKELLKHAGSLWTFVRVEGVEPTNNAAERALRKPVIYRKRCFGVDSWRGARFVERSLSVVESLKKQGKDVLGFLESALQLAAR